MSNSKDPRFVDAFEGSEARKAAATQQGDAHVAAGRQKALDREAAEAEGLRRERAIELVNNLSTDRSMKPQAGQSLGTVNGLDFVVNDNAVLANLRQLREVNAGALQKLPPTRESLRTNNKLKVLTNHFEVKINAGVSFYKYQITGIPDGSKRKKRMFVDTIIQNCDILQNNKQYFATDYINTIISWKKLFDDDKTASEPLTEISERDYELVPIGLQYMAKIDTESLQKFVQTDPSGSIYNDSAWGKDTVIQALNIVISKRFKQDVIQRGSEKFFVPTGHQEIGHSLCVIRGYNYTARAGMGKILLQLAAGTSAFFQPIPLSNAMQDRNFKNDLSVFKGLRVYIDYERGRDKKNAAQSFMNLDKARIKRIFGFGRNTANQTFDLTRDEFGNDLPTPQTISVVKYFDRQYGMAIRGDLKAVNLGSRDKPSWYPAERLIIMPYQIYAHLLPFDLQPEMIKKAKYDPGQYAGQLQGECLSSVQLGGVPVHDDLKHYPLTIDNHMLRVPYFRMDSPKVIYKNKQQFLIPRDAKWNLESQKFKETPANTLSYVTMTLSNHRLLNGTVAAYRNKFETQVRDRGVAQHPRSCGEVSTGPSESQIGGCLEKIAIGKHQGVHGIPNVILLILAQKDLEVYSSFKYLCDRIYGFQSIVLTQKANMKKKGNAPPEFNPGGLDQLLGNISMKANLKTGGINHTAEHVDRILKDTLVLGADVTHPGLGALGGTPSIAAIVGSVDSSGGKFLGSVRFQSLPNKEIIDDVQDMVCERVLDWYHHNEKQFPKNILYYRDGVSDSQYIQVRNLELPLIDAGFLQALKKVQQSEERFNATKAKLTAVIVTKRHRTRFFPENKDQGTRNGNCFPGTLVEKGVTSPYYTDFYLQSHLGLQGTARPARYDVLKNEIEGLTTQELQDLTHRLNHTYVRATMGVSYAAPAYYADRLCERVRCYVRPFLAPTSQNRSNHDDVKDKFMRQRIDARERPNKSDDDRKKKRKTAQEIKEDKEDTDFVANKLTAIMKERCEARLKAGDAMKMGRAARQARRDRLSQTMYWM